VQKCPKILENFRKLLNFQKVNHSTETTTENSNGTEIIFLKRGKSIDIDPYPPKENCRKRMNNCEEDADLSTGNNKSSSLKSVRCANGNYNRISC